MPRQIVARRWIRGHDELMTTETGNGRQAPKRSLANKLGRAVLFVGIQTSLILSHGGPGNIGQTISEFLLSVTNGGDSLLWLPARAAMGDLGAFLQLTGFSLLLVALALQRQFTADGDELNRVEAFCYLPWASVIHG